MATLTTHNGPVSEDCAFTNPVEFGASDSVATVTLSAFSGTIRVGGRHYSRFRLSCCGVSGDWGEGIAVDTPVPVTLTVMRRRLPSDDDGYYLSCYLVLT